MGRDTSAAAAAFAETLDDLGITKLDDAAGVGRRAALLAVADRFWAEHLGPLLEGNQVQELLGVRSRQAVNDLVRRGRLLALPGPEGRLLYPAFQFSPSGRPYEAMPKVLAALEEARIDAHTTASWFKTPQRALGDVTPARWLASGKDVERLVEAARRTAARMGH